MLAINEAMEFDTDPTQVTTTAAEAFALKRGVCQDATHIFLAAARHLGIPSRYVSGHFCREDDPSVQEAGHAWAETYIEKLGWVGFDPTNGISPTEAHVRVAIGLDYLGAAPVRGTRYGGGGETLKVAVRVAPTGSQSQSQITILVRTKKRPMTYCCGILVREGLVMIADTRTNAGLDNVSTFRKLHVWTQPGERIMALASSGNLSLSQTVRSMLTEGIENPETGELETLMNAPTMFKAAQRIGDAVRHIQALEGKALAEASVDHEVAFLFGGQVKGGRLRLFMIYSAGNFIECTTDTPYLQIGEHKYGKPVLDRAISFDTDIYDSLKIGLISMDSTMRSNLAVGLPIDLLVARRDTCTSEVNYRIEPGEPYFQDLRERWSGALRAAHIAIPRPPYRSLV